MLAPGTRRLFVTRLLVVLGLSFAISGFLAGPASGSSVPDAPTGVMAVPGDAIADVSWTAGASDGGSAIMDYTATSSPGGLSCTSPVSTTCEVSGLTDGVAYTFTVEAFNANGPSVASDPSSPVTPQAAPQPPDPPSIVALTPGVGDIIVTIAPAGTGPTPTSFVVISTVDSQECSISAAAAPLSCEQTGLTPGDMYSFVAEAIGAGGPSAPSATSGEATPLGSPPPPPFEPPTAPLDVVATPGVGSVSVTWDPPASDGGAEVTSYLVTTNPDGLTCSSADASGCVITGLTSGTNYDIAVIAVNVAGPSEPAFAGPVTALDSSDPTTPVIPGSSAAPNRLRDHSASPSDSSSAPSSVDPSASVGPSASVSPTDTASMDGPADTPDTDTSTASAVLTLHLTVGEQAAGTSVGLSGSGFEPGSDVVLTMHSTPVVLGTVSAAPDGSVSGQYVLPSSIDAGTHRLIVDGVDSTGRSLTQTWYFQVDAQGVTQHVGSQPSASPPTWANSAPSGLVQVGQFLLEPYNVLAHPAAAIDTEVSAMTLLAVVGGLGLASQRQAWRPDPGDAAVLAAAGAGVAATAAHKGRSGGLAGAKAKHLKFREEAEKAGDRSRTWVTPGVDAIDEVALSLPEKLNRFSPLAARIATDAAYLRAIFGSTSLLLPLTGLVFGILAVIQTGGVALPPSTWLVFAIVVLGIIDVAGGFVAATAFSIGVVACGGVGSAADLRTLLGVDVVFFTVALTAAAMRPLRRAPAGDSRYWFDRGADSVVASLIGMWALTKTVGALPALSGLALPIAGSANRLALAAGAAIAARYLIETVAAHWYPARLAAVAPPSFGSSSNHQQLFSTAFNTTVFVFFAQAYMGDVWELWVGAALFVLPSVVGIYKSKLPNLPPLVRWLPGGVIKIVVMFFVAKWASMLLKSAVHDPAHMIPLGFVFLGLPGLFLSFLGFFARDGDTWKPNWLTRIGGIGVVALGVVLVEGILTIA